MNKRDFFVAALKAEMFRYKKWIISCFAFTDGDVHEAGSSKSYWLTTQPNDKKRYFFSPDDGTTLIAIEGSSVDQRLLDFKERLTLQPGDLPNVKEVTDTTYGNALFNAMVLCWAFGDEVPYQNGRVNGGALERVIAGLLSAGTVSVAQHLRYMEAMGALGGLSQLCTPSASPKTMTIDPAILKRRDELFREHADRLHDPAVMAAIDKELSAMDRASFKGDDAENFFIKAKTFDVSRKKAYISYGEEKGFGEATGQTTLIKKSLREGLDFNEMAAIADSARAGSFFRGNQTALGGESVKYFYRIFQNTKIAEDDCGSTSGLWWEVDDNNWKSFVGRYMQLPNGPVRIDEALAKGAIGKRILVRSPFLCKTVEPSFCVKCAGDGLALNPTGVHVAVSDVGSTFMLVSMKKMHGVALSTAPYNPRKAIT